MLTLDDIMERYIEFASDDELDRCVAILDGEFKRRTEELEKRD